jgi:hypothetical protein
MTGYPAVAPASLRTAKRVVNESGALAVGRREVRHVVAAEQPFQSRPVAEVAPEFLPPAEMILREASLEVEDPGGRESETVRFDGHRSRGDLGRHQPRRPAGRRLRRGGGGMDFPVGDLGGDRWLPDRSHLCRHPPEVATRGGDQR